MSTIPALEDQVQNAVRAVDIAASEPNRPARLALGRKAYRVLSTVHQNITAAGRVSEFRPEMHAAATKLLVDVFEFEQPVPQVPQS